MGDITRRDAIRKATAVFASAVVAAGALGSEGTLDGGYGACRVEGCDCNNFIRDPDKKFYCSECRHRQSDHEQK